MPTIPPSAQGQVRTPRIYPTMPPDGNPDDCPKCGRPHLRCAGHNRKGLPCRNWPPVGGRVCKRHGGQLPSIKKHVDKVQQQMERDRLLAEIGQEVQLRMGDAVVVDVVEEMMRQIFISAGTAEYLRQKVSSLEETDHIEEDAEANIYRKNLYIDMWNDERRTLFDFCAKARAAGVEDAQVALAQAQAEMVAKVLDLSAVQLKANLVAQFDLNPADANALEGKIREILGTQLMLVAENSFPGQTALNSPNELTHTKASTGRGHQPGH